MAKRPVPTKAQMHKLFRKWRERMGLTDWEIKFVLVSDGSLSNNWGQVEHQAHKKCAVIKVVDPGTVADPSPYEYSVAYEPEVTIVHELLHLFLSPFQTKSNSVEEVFEEQIVHKLSNLLVALDRKDPGLVNPFLHTKLSAVAAF